MGVVGIEKDMNIYYSPMLPILGRPWSTGCWGGGRRCVVGVGGFQLMIERIDQLWLYISCSKSSFFVPFGGPSGYMHVLDLCAYYFTIPLSASNWICCTSLG
jgi:hypothetical protein